jgi:hypothetical protein
MIVIGILMLEVFLSILLESSRIAGGLDVFEKLNPVRLAYTYENCIR